MPLGKSEIVMTEPDSSTTQAVRPRRDAVRHWGHEHAILFLPVEYVLPAFNGKRCDQGHLERSAKRRLALSSEKTNSVGGPEMNLNLDSNRRMAKPGW